MTRQLDDLAGAYGDDSPYALDNRLILDWYPRRIAGWVSGGSLLELGIGHGYSSLALTPHFARHLIVEGSRELIDRFRQQPSARGIEIAHDLFETFDTVERFDVVVIGFVLEHVEDPQQLLRRYRQFLADEGVVFVAVPNSRALNRRLGHAAGLLSDFEVLGEADRALGHQRWFTVESLYELAAACGYRVVRTEGLLLKPITTEQMLRLELSEEVLQAMLEVGIEYPELCVGILAELAPEKR